jgi:hypothetical protein
LAALLSVAYSGRLQTLLGRGGGDSQGTYDVTMRVVRGTIIAVEKQYVLHIPLCVFSLSYPACNAQAPYTTVSHIIHKQHDFRKRNGKGIEHNMCLILTRCTVHLLLFCTVTNKCTIISQIITLLLHVSTILCHPQTARSQYLAKLRKNVNAVVCNTI